MTKHAIFVRHRTLPGMRDEVQRVWRKHMLPAVAANAAHEAYDYCIGTEPDVLCAFQRYADPAAAAAFLATPEYAAYLEEVSPLLTGEPEVLDLEVVWSKGSDTEHRPKAVRPSPASTGHVARGDASASAEHTILRIDASARTTRSLTRGLADRFLAEWRTRRPSDRVLRRDIGVSPPPAISEDWIAAAFTPEGDRTAEQKEQLALSDALIDELRQADLLVVAAPMYNYGMPATLKAWVDQVIRVDETFTFDLSRGDWPLEPVLGGKTLVLLTSSGEFGYAPGGPRAGMDHLTSHLEVCSPYLGVAETHRIGIEFQEFGDDRHRRSGSEASQEVVRLAERLVRGISPQEATAAATL